MEMGSFLLAARDFPGCVISCDEAVNKRDRAVSDLFVCA
jgi:hypothetical protein